MTITAAQVMTLAGRVLQDESAARWTYPELCDWINEAVKAIVAGKPSSASVTVVLALSQGTWQSIGIGNLSLLRVTRNITNAGPPPVGGRIVRVTTREVLDAQSPYWHSPTQTPYQKEVRQFVFDEEDPRSFYVYPGNDGTGQIEALVSQLPALIIASGDVNTMTSYNQNINLPDIYLSPILDFVLFRAMSKEDAAANPAGAMMHFQAFAAAMGMKTQVEGANSPNARTKVTGT